MPKNGELLLKLMKCFSIVVGEMAEGYILGHQHSLKWQAKSDDGFGCLGLTDAIAWVRLGQYLIVEQTENFCLSLPIAQKKLVELMTEKQRR